MPGPVDPRPLSVAILAGGASSRMGTDKALVVFDGEPMLARIARRLSVCTDDLFVVGSPRDGVRLRYVPDVTDERSPLAGVITALATTRCDRVFVCACDMPHIDAATVGELATDAPVPVVARRDGRPEPLAAVWPVSVRPVLEAAWADGERAVHRALERCGARAVDVTDPAALTNVNTPADIASLSRPPA